MLRQGREAAGTGLPGGPAIERAAAGGDAGRFPLPRPLKGRPGCNFSFSGLKTALRETVAALGGTAALTPRDVADLAAGLQAAIGDCLVDRTGHAIAEFAARHCSGPLVVAGGVAANRVLRAQLADLATQHGLAFTAPPPELCTDNGAMIAWAGLERLRAGLVDRLDFAPLPRWPLDPAAPRATGAGVKA